MFVVPPLAGHAYPAAAVARTLSERGHEVAWVGSQVRLRPFVGPDATVHPAGMRAYRVELVGPALADRPGAPDFPWDWLDPSRRHVLVTAGTVAEDLAAGPASFYSRATQALGPLGNQLQVIMITAPSVTDDPSGHILAAERVPLLALMPRLDAVVCHGGLNTVCEALAHGVPLVVAPIRWDQPFNAAQVAGSGAGIRVNFGRVSPEQLRTAVTAVLDDPAYRRAAARIRDSFAEAGGRHRAADLLERLAYLGRKGVLRGTSDFRN